MGAALITASQITFKYDEVPQELQEEQKPQPVFTEEDRKQAQLAEQLNLPSLADTRASDLPQGPREHKVGILSNMSFHNLYNVILDENFRSNNA